MTEFFIVAVTKPAPFFGDQIIRYVEGETAELALHYFLDQRNDTDFLSQVWVYRSADDFHKNHQPELHKRLAN